MMREERAITINSRKYDQSIRRSWKCRLIEENDDYYLFLGEFEDEVKHSQLGIIRPGTISYEFYWKREYYNVFRFHEPNGEFRNFYCNLNTPPILSRESLDYVDLDIDILVWKDFSIEILDLEEYEANSKKYQYPLKLKRKVDESLEKLLNKINAREFPFDMNR